jgi:3-hydroxy-9,10-secoandrosta-1,3,5(10)-triene-9,17-dione monooxygenase
MTMVDTGLDADLIARTRAIIPQLAARAEETSALRHVPEENIRLMQAAGSLKIIQAKRNGGYGSSMRTHLEVVASLAEGCGATAWVAGVTMAHSWLLSHFPVQAQDDAYANPDSVVAAVIGPRGVAVKTADGFSLSGFWPFASGNRNSEWLLLGGVVKNEAGEVIDEGDFLVPTSAVTQLDDWFVNGLTGTGSSSVKVENLHIPAHRFCSLPSVVMGQSPGASVHGADEWNLRCAPVPVLALALTGSAIGIARQALRDFPGLVKGKVIAYTADDQYSHPLTHIQAGNAAMLIHEGELILFNCADQIDAAAREGRELDFNTRARMRLDCAQGVRRLLEGVEVLFHASGASGIRLASPLTRAIADLRAINQHGLLNLETNQELYGRIVLGLPQNSPLI